MCTQKYSCVCAQARESWLIIKRQLKRAHAAKVFCNLRGLTQRGFNTCNTAAMPQSATQIHFKGFSAYSLTYLRRTKWLHCNIYPIKPSPCSPASSFFFLFSCFCSIQFELAYLLQPPCNGPCFPLSPALAHLPIAAETDLDRWILESLCVCSEGGRLYWTHYTHTHTHTNYPELGNHRIRVWIYRASICSTFPVLHVSMWVYRKKGRNTSCSVNRLLPNIQSRFVFTLP